MRTIAPILVTLLLLSSPLHATCTFGLLGPTSYPANDKPGDVTTGDFNHDGYVDVAVVNRTMMYISILLGTANGGLGQPTQIPTEWAQSDIQAADFNNDGHLDLVMAIPWSNDFSVYPHLKVLLGNGTGAFTAVPYTSQQLVYQNPENIVLHDFNKDGKMDAATTKSDAEFSSMQNVGGLFAQKAEYETGGYLARGIAVGDFDGDGNADVALASFYQIQKVFAFFGLGDGTFTPGPTPIDLPHAQREPEDVEAGDFNGDGKDDLAIITRNPYTSDHGPLKIALSNGVARTFGTPVDYGTLLWAVEMAVKDMDGDSHLDVLVAGSSGLMIFRGIGDGTFAASQTYGPGGLGLAIDDFNRDGGPDVILTNFGGGQVSILRNSCARATMNLHSSSNPASQGTPLTVTGSVLAPPAAAAPTGTFTLKRGTTMLGTATLPGTNTLQSMMSDLVPGSYTFTLEYSGDSLFAPSTKTLQQVVTVPPFGPPPGLNAISFGGPVQLGWYATASTDHYEIWRNNGAGWVLAGTAGAAAFTDNAAPSSAALVYKVRAVATGGTTSEFGAMDLALTYAFTDPTLTAGATSVKLAHLFELRTAANSVRAIASLGGFAWSEPSPTLVRASHLTELRTAIAAARTSLGLPAASYDDDPLNLGMTIKATHFEQLRGAMR